MDQHEIGAVERSAEVEFLRIEHGHGKIWISRAPGGERARSEIDGQIARAPSLFGLEGVYAETAPLQFAEHTAQEMRIAMIPVGAQGVAEQYDLRHHATRGSAEPPVSSR